MSRKDWFNHCIDAEVQLIRSLPIQKIDAYISIVEEAHSSDKQLFIYGNGGNAARASHLAYDLGQGYSAALVKRFRVRALKDNAPWLTALGNDYAYEDVFVMQLENFAQPGEKITRPVPHG